MGHLRYAVRSLLRSPGFTLAAITCLALGIGANTAIFTVVNAVLFRPLPFKNPHGLVRIYTEFPTYGSSGGFRKFWMSTPELLDLRRIATSWESLDAYTLNGVNLSGNSEAATRYCRQHHGRSDACAWGNTTTRPLDHSR